MRRLNENISDGRKVVTCQNQSKTRMFSAVVPTNIEPNLMVNIFLVH